MGKLLKPGEVPTNYSDEEDEGSQQETESKSEQEESKTTSDHQGAESKSKNDWLLNHTSNAKQFQNDIAHTPLLKKLLKSWLMDICLEIQLNILLQA